jgi:hypothetical protein
MLVVVAVLAPVGCSGAATQSLVRGEAVIACGPGYPVPPGEHVRRCRPEPAVNAHLRIKTLGERMIHQERHTDGSGRFEVRLKAGRYLVYGDPVRNKYGVPTPPLGPVSIVVRRGRITKIHLFYDNGAA